MGNHTLKFGGDVNRVSDLLDNLFQEGGAYSYSNVVDFISDFAIPSGRRYSSYGQGFGPSAFFFKTTDYNFFIQDDFRVSPKLTVNLGLRYEYEQLPEPQIPNPAVAQTSVFPADRTTSAHALVLLTTLKVTARLRFAVATESTTVVSLTRPSQTPSRTRATRVASFSSASRRPPSGPPY